MVACGSRTTIAGTLSSCIAGFRQSLRSYTDYYNGVRTHRSLDKDAPVTRQIQRIGSIKSHAILGGLHHHYARA
jgi:hypothetical protein